MTQLTNWAGNQRWQPAEVVTPRDEDAVAASLTQAAARGQRLKVVGGGHSWSDAAVTDGVTMRLDHLNRVLHVGDDSVTVEAGIRLGDLVAALDRAGLALPMLPSITSQTVAGAIATATHGSSLHHGSLSSFVRGARLVTPVGAAIDIGPADDRLDAVRVHLGALGVVTRVTLDVVEQFWLAESMRPVPLEDAADGVADLAASAEFVKLWWFPDTDRGVLFTYERTDARKEISRAARGVERSLNRLAFPTLLAAGRRFPALIPSINRSVGALYARPQTRSGRSQDVLTLHMPPRNREVEFALPPERGPEAIRTLVRLAREPRLGVNFPAEFRFGPAESGWMSGAHGRATIHVGAYMADGPGQEAYFTEFERSMVDLGGRPHPGKEHGRVPSAVLDRYQRGGDFRALAHELDPDAMFMNPFLERWFGPR